MNLHVKLGGATNYNPLEDCAECTIAESLYNNTWAKPIKFYRVRHKYITIRVSEEFYDKTFGLCKSHLDEPQNPDSKYFWLTEITREEVEVERVMKE